MNAVSRLLVWLLALALIALPVAGVVQGWWGGAYWPLRTLRVDGALQRVDRAQLRAAVLPLARRGFFAVDLAAIQGAVGKVAWVERAEVRKQWPDVIEVRIREYRPYAHWGRGRVLSERGHLFPAGTLRLPAGMPVFDGPDARVPDVVRLYNQASDQLASVGGVHGVVLDRRGSWTITLKDGTNLVLGRNDPEQRLSRFAALLSQLQAQDPQRRLARADLRYTNGFALTWVKADPAVTRPSETDARPTLPSPIQTPGTRT
ncbi:MAG: cell division protein FtsQ/DivIB [Thermomonas sp.]|uniref:cell division protein FtsQ/DivIB n=1 Tax=Thermomonas sp. TaxID=1971895 RepID=UPI00262C457C|nr:cell division protein FtsQ/DivIB [Thermomonas sp.]MCC7096384.1 cell division protein FtsQ/DivIB [Thermomonas sp.]